MNLAKYRKRKKNMKGPVIMAKYEERKYLWLFIQDQNSFRKLFLENFMAAKVQGRLSKWTIGEPNKGNQLP